MNTLFACYKSLRISKRTLLRFIKYSRVSIFFIFIIILLISQIEMGGDIVITLFENASNLVFTLLLIFIIAVPTSHYPVYFRVRANIRRRTTTYIFSINKNLRGIKKILRFSPFRIIYYKRDSHSDIKEDMTLNSFQFSVFRRSMGILLFVALIYIFLNTYKTYINHKLPASFLSLLILAFLFTFLVYISFLKKMADDMLYDKTVIEEKTISNFRNVVLSLYRLIVASILFLIITYFVVLKNKWSGISVFTTILTLLIFAITFIVFSVSRSWLKYVYHSDKIELKSEDNAPNYIDDTYRNNIKPASKRILNINKLYWFSDNIIYLRGFILLGALLISFFVIVNKYWQLNHYINFIIVLLVAYMIYYGLFIIYLKHRMYANFTKNDTSFRFKKAWSTYIPHYLVPLFFSIAISSVLLGNDLHYIQNNSKRNYPSKNEVKLTTFENSITNQKKHVFVSAYGGGLKSNLWTMLVLDCFEDSIPNFLNKVRCFSGVSGGGVGFANYMLLDTNSIKRKKEINAIANYNFITLDLTFLLGRDLLSEYTPSFYKFKGKDRAYYGMKQHLIAMGKDANLLENTSFYTAYYHRFYKTGYFPPLIINTISTKGIQGIAFSIPVDNSKKFDSIFPGAINILNTSSKTTLRYLGAVSTTNRFPILSPSASIEGKGHFIDGGAFDNSAILSTENLKNYFINKHTLSNKEIYFINISVSKNAYIKKFIQKYKLTTHAISASAELPAIIGTASATQSVPNYISHKLNNYENFYQIILPHTFSFKDLERVLGGKLDASTIEKEKVLKGIDSCNVLIKKLIQQYSKDSYLKNLVVQPATGRLMSKPSINYQKVMLHHPSVIEQFDTIQKLLKN